MANNIYDLAGNVYEWTQEASDTYVRASRGGNYPNNGSRDPASDRYRQQSGHQQLRLPTVLVQL